ncbi:Cd2+/Zn2+-exporting ATPase [Halolactibacillus halophilus]|uniref:Cd(2+)-exporting ATPase n=1 Tax=Halolactibacillus halophilus TaxID=306540 RepID=A0A1I5LZ02_9BACI|nr:heavy metal translocating P-type ATPase [Halolactibacillus halophilus]GEM00928.1 haloacid dehalogenase [Halolactibacillus halophilus]SFP01981.1 Cd2+/Zn2+-exporting ATPase [Halolactibacillus halophilus]
MAQKMTKFKSIAMISSGLVIALAFLLNLIGANHSIDILLVVATVLTGIPIVYFALQALKFKYMSIDLLVSIAIIGAIVIGEYVESSVVGFLFLFGSFLEARTLARTRESIQSLMALAPDEAILLKDGQEVKVAVGDVALDDIVIVKAGGKVPVDGAIISGEAQLNEAMMTGESVPREKTTGEAVFSGTIVDEGYIKVQAKKVGEDTAFNQIIELVEEAQDQKSQTEKFLDRFSQYYTPGVVILSVIVYLMTQNLHLAITFLVIACPGALVIGAPVSNVSGIGNAAKNGVLLKGGDAVDRFKQATTFMFDKTGTLTKGEPAVTNVVSFIEADWLFEVAELERHSEHHLGRAIVDYAKKTHSLTDQHLDVTLIKGQGLCGFFDGQQYTIGNRRLMDAQSIEITSAVNKQIEAEEAEGKTVVIVAKEARVIGYLVINDVMREEAKTALAALKHNGARDLVMLTGDNEKTAQYVAKQLGITSVRAELQPKDKLEEIKQRQQKGEKVVMVGDGVNDAPALALSDIGIAMGLSGTDVAIETADVVVMNDRLDKLVHAYRLAKATVKNRTQNIAIALLTVFFLLLGVLNGTIHLASGMFVHEASVLIVILNGMRLIRYQPK